MADISDVEGVMVSLIAGFLGLGSSYLPGSAVPCASAQGPCRVYRGWPTATALDKDIASGISNISVFPVAGASRRTTRYVPEWHTQAAVTPTLTATLSGDEIIFAGTAASNQVVGVSFGVGNDLATYAYRVLAADTPASISSAFAGLIPNAIATATGPVLTIPSQENLEVIVVADQPMWMETRRQEQHVWVIGWCASPAIRDTLMSAVDQGFAGMTTPTGALTDQFPLPDGSSARLLYMSTHTDDMPQKAAIWRRDLRYVVCYPSTIVQPFTPMVFGTTTVTETVSDISISTAIGPPSD